MKRILSLMLTVFVMATMLTAMPVFASEEITDESGFVFLIENGEAVLDGWVGENDDFAEIVIPSTVNGYLVTKIKDYALEDLRCSTLTIPASITEIGDYALETAYVYGEIIVQEGNENFTVSNGTLFNKDKTTLLYCVRNKSGEYIIPDSVTKIGAGAIDCYDITSITIPENVTEICSPIGSVSLATINYNAINCNPVSNMEDAFPFFNASNEMTVTLNIGNKVEVIPDYAFANLNIEELVIPDNVTKIGAEAFSDCDALKDVKIGNGVKRICEGAFVACEMLQSVTVGSGVERIESLAFHSCYNLKDIYIADLAAWCNIDFGAEEANPLMAAVYNGEYYGTVEERNIYINNKLVKDLVIPNGVKEIKSRAFNGYSNFGDSFLNFNSVTIPDSVEVIGDYAFEDCGIGKLNIGSGLKKIGKGVIGCERLNIKDIGTWCEIEYDGDDAPVWCETVSVNNKTLTELIIPDGVTKINDYVFAGWYNIRSAVIPDSVKEIGGKAFYGCDSLTTIDIGSGVEIIGSKENEAAFTDSTGIVDVYYNGTEEQWDNIKIYGDIYVYDDDYDTYTVTYEFGEGVDPYIHYISKLYTVPKASVTPGLVPFGTKVKLLHSSSDADIYYTLDGSQPTTLSKKYTEPIIITKNTVIKAFSVEKGRAASDVVTFEYTGYDVDIEFIKVSGYGRLMLIASENIPTGAIILKNEYKGDIWLGTETEVYVGGAFYMNISEEADQISVFVWDGLDSIMPLTLVSRILIP